IKDVLSSKTKEDAEKILPRISSLLDKLASKRIIHRNKAANQKSRLTIFVNNL
ncbi:30S ribosomal protein S20, partial [candidate division KSB1 bacterium]|nr:30S ribosomal protein S20 [candidate division KSB1 bacterium]